MPFFDWWGFAGTGIQSAFAWIGYNRDAFADNVSMRQAQKYQQKNYQISWIAIARDDIRDMMGISVNRINNYMIVATLILSVAAGAVTGVTFNAQCPTFIMFTFYLSIGLALVYLMLAIMFGVKGQNSAFTNTMKLLTYQVRPENPAEYSHDYMKQAQWIERQGMAALFRIPGVLPAYNTDTEADHAPGLQEKWGTLKKSATTRGGTFASVGKSNHRTGEVSKGPQPTVNLEDATPLESLVKRTTHTWYLTKFTQFMRLWQPYDTYSKYSMGLGIICLGQGSAYFALGRISSEDRFLDEWAACVLTFTFVYMVLLVTMENFKAKSPVTRRSVMFLLTAGPCCGAVGAVTQFQGLKQIAIPFCFLCHTLFWLFGFVFTLRELKDDANDAFVAGSPFFSDKDASGTSPNAENKSGEGNEARQGLRQTVQEPCPGTIFGKGQEPSRTPSQADPGTGNPNDHWPTDDEEFSEKAIATNLHIQQTVRYTLAMSTLLWFSMFLWAVAKWWVDPIAMTVRQAMGSPEVLLVDEVPVVWPGPLFRPRAVACAASQIFVTDGFRIFELSQNGGAAVAEVSCPVDRPILDIAASCAAGGRCSPLALVAGTSESRGASEVIDCAQGVTWPLLQDEWPADRFAVLHAGLGVRNSTEHRLVTLRGMEMVQFAWSEDRRGFVPEWMLGSSELFVPPAVVDRTVAPVEVAEPLRAGVSGAAEGRLLVWQTAALARPALEIRDASNMGLLGRWRVPAAVGPVAGSCALDEGSALVLPAASTTSDGDDHPRLMRVSMS